VRSRKTKPKPTGDRKRAPEEFGRDVPAFAAYIVLLMRLLAFLTVELHDPTQPAPSPRESPAVHADRTAPQQAESEFRS
jgi:hypothetical protein